jgi:hypothetical protein
MNWLGDVPEDYTTVVCMFTTHDGNGAPVAPLSAFEAADVKIYKNGVNTEKTTTNGVTMTSPFDSIVGLHCVVIDTSNDTGDSGFWTTGGGGTYTIVLNPDTETVNGQTALKVLGAVRHCSFAGPQTNDGGPHARRERDRRGGYRLGECGISNDIACPDWHHHRDHARRSMSIRSRPTPSPMAGPSRSRPTPRWPARRVLSVR